MKFTLLMILGIGLSILAYEVGMSVWAALTDKGDKQVWG